MELWFAALLGTVQGLTEFIPVSSSAHLRIAPALLDMADPGAAFSAVIQLGTLLALLVYFFRDIFIDMPRAMLSDRSAPEARMPLYITVGTIPIVVIGLLFKDYIVGDLRSLYVVSTALVAVGLLMVFSDKRETSRELDQMTFPIALAIGFAQACALVPGVSRSGATIVCAVLLGFRAAGAARFSFYLGIPAIAGAGIFELPDAMSSLGEGALAAIAVGTVVSAISGYACIAWLLRYLAKGKLAAFGLYRVALGLLLVVLCLTELLAPL